MAKYVSEESRARKKRIRRNRRIAGLCLRAVFVLVVSFGIVRVIEHFQTPKTDTPIIIEEEIQNPNTDVEKQGEDYDTFTGPVANTINLGVVTPEMKMIQVAENGRVDVSYFSDAVFMGDSLCDSFHIYACDTLGIERNSWHFMTKKSLSPSSFTQPGVLIDFDNGLGAINPWEELMKHDVRKVYVCIGTNTLQGGKDIDAFIEEYRSMIRMIKGSAPNAVIYIMTIPPTAATIQAKMPNISIERVYEANSAIARMCNEEGLALINSYDVLKSGAGYLREDICASDGVHLTPSGTREWADYLITHTVYNPSSPYIPGSPYYM